MFVKITMETRHKGELGEIVFAAEVPYETVGAICAKLDKGGFISGIRYDSRHIHGGRGDRQVFRISDVALNSEIILQVVPMDERLISDDGTVLFDPADCDEAA